MCKEQRKQASCDKIKQIAKKFDTKSNENYSLSYHDSDA